MNTLQRLQRGTTGKVDQDIGAVSGLAWVVGVCAIVLTAWLLGAAWLTRTLLGIPAGLWIIGLVLGGRWGSAKLLGGPRGVVFAPQSPQRETSDSPADTHPPLETNAIPAEPLRAAGVVPIANQVAANVTEGAVSIVRASSGGTLPGWLERMREAGGTPGRSLHQPLRVGVKLDGFQVRALEEAPAALPMAFVPYSGAGDADQLRRLGFDAVIEQNGSEGGVIIHVAEAPDAPAAWHDWASALPLSYGSLFPARIDPSVVSIERLEWSDQGAVAVVRSLLETAALLSRYPSRLGFGDRLRKRPALGLALGSPMVGDPALDRAMAHMASVLAGRTREQVGQSERAAMRVLAAYLAWSGCGLLPEDRVQAARTINRLGPAEGETYLRACVAAFAGGQEVLGFDLMLSGHERLAVERPEPLVDPMEYLISDISYNRGGAETIGKLAAGLAYATAFIDRPKVAYILDDVRDEAMSANWLTINPDVRDQVLAIIEALSTIHMSKAAA